MSYWAVSSLVTCAALIELTNEIESTESVISYNETKNNVYASTYNWKKSAETFIPKTVTSVGDPVLKHTESLEVTRQGNGHLGHNRK